MLSVHSMKLSPCCSRILSQGCFRNPRRLEAQESYFHHFSLNQWKIFPASHYFLYNIKNTGQNIGVSASASVLPMSIQGWFLLRWTGWISLQSKGVSCPNLRGPMDCSPPGSSIHGILQVRILEWVAVPFSRGSSPPRDQTQASHIAGRFFTIWAARGAGFIITCTVLIKLRPVCL